MAKNTRVKRIREMSTEDSENEKTEADKLWAKKVQHVRFLLRQHFNHSPKEKLLAHEETGECPINDFIVNALFKNSIASNEANITILRQNIIYWIKLQPINAENLKRIIDINNKIASYENNYVPLEN